MIPNSPATSPTSVFRRILSPPTLTGLYRHSVAWFLASLILLFIAAPFIQGLRNGRYLGSIIVTLVLIAAVMAVGGRRRSLAVACVLAVPVVIGWWLQHHQSAGFQFQIFLVSFILFLSFVLFQFIRFILRAPKVDSEVLCAGVSTYLLLALWWTAAYTLTARLVPGSFSGLPPDAKEIQGFEALYFSLITLTTVGYGDIAPLTRPARMLAMVEALTGTLYMAVLVARLVSQHSSLSPTPPPPPTPPNDQHPLA